MLALARILTYGGFRIQTRRAYAGRGGRVSAIRAALLPPHSGPEREVQHPAIAPWPSSERIFKLLDTEPAIVSRRRLRSRSSRHRAPSNSTTSGSRTRTKTGCCAMSASPSHPARPSPWWATPAPARPRSSACCCASTTCRRAASAMGGVDMREFDPLELRRQFGVVLQDPYLFTGTLAENIRLGTETIRDEEVEAAAEQVNLLDFIRTPAARVCQHPMRERGSGLSTGQKQLISFARALAHNPRFPDSRRSYVECGYRDRISRARGAGPHGGRPHVASSSRTGCPPSSAPTAFW